MSLLNFPYRPFPRVLSSPSAPSSRISASTRSTARSWWNSPSAPARWSESGRMADSAPNTGFEPKLANFFGHTDLEHTPINIPDSHHDFLCPDDVTMIPTSPEGLPNSEAFTSSQKAVASRVSSLFGHLSLCVGSSWPPGDWGRVGQRICCNNASQFKREKRSRHKRCACVERQKIPKRSLNGKLTWPSEERERGSAKNCIRLRQRLRREIGKRDILILLFRRSIKNLSLSDFSYTMQADGEIRLREIELACMVIGIEK